MKKKAGKTPNPSKVEKVNPQKGSRMATETVEDIEKMAESLRELASEIEEPVETMRRLGIDSIHVNGNQMMNRAFLEIDRYAGQIVRGFQREKAEQRIRTNKD